MPPLFYILSPNPTLASALLLHIVELSATPPSTYCHQTPPQYNPIQFNELNCNGAKRNENCSIYGIDGSDSFVCWCFLLVFSCWVCSFLSILLVASSEALVFIVVYYRPSAAVTLSDVELFCPFLSQGSTRTI